MPVSAEASVTSTNPMHRAHTVSRCIPHRALKRVTRSVGAMEIACTAVDGCRWSGWVSACGIVPAKQREHPAVPSECAGGPAVEQHRARFEGVGTSVLLEVGVAPRCVVIAGSAMEA